MDLIEGYRKAFIFGIKFILLIVALAIPPFIGITLGSWVDDYTQKFHFLYIPDLKITAVQEFEPVTGSSNWRKIDLTSGGSVYFTTNRPMDILNEYNRATNKVIDIINNTYSVERINVKDKGIVYDLSDYYGTVIYGHHTSIGNFVIIPIDIALVIICLALYFPLFRAIINLFKRGKVLGDNF